MGEVSDGKCRNQQEAEGEGRRGFLVHESEAEIRALPVSFGHHLHLRAISISAATSTVLRSCAFRPLYSPVGPSRSTTPRIVPARDAACDRPVCTSTGRKGGKENTRSVSAHSRSGSGSGSRLLAAEKGHLREHNTTAGAERPSRLEKDLRANRRVGEHGRECLAGGPCAGTGEEREAQCEAAAAEAAGAATGAAAPSQQNSPYASPSPSALPRVFRGGPRTGSVGVRGPVRTEQERIERGHLRPFSEGGAAAGALGGAHRQEAPSGLLKRGELRRGRKGGGVRSDARMGERERDTKLGGEGRAKLRHPGESLAAIIRYSQRLFAHTWIAGLHVSSSDTQRPLYSPDGSPFAPPFVPAPNPESGPPATVPAGTISLVTLDDGAADEVEATTSSNLTRDPPGAPSPGAAAAGGGGGGSGSLRCSGRVCFAVAIVSRGSVMRTLHHPAITPTSKLAPTPILPPPPR